MRTGAAFFSALRTAKNMFPLGVEDDVDERDVTNPREKTKDPTPTSIYNQCAFHCKWMMQLTKLVPKSSHFP